MTKNPITIGTSSEPSTNYQKCLSSLASLTQTFMSLSLWQLWFSFTGKISNLHSCPASNSSMSSRHSHSLQQRRSFCFRNIV